MQCIEEMSEGAATHATQAVLGPTRFYLIWRPWVPKTSPYDLSYCHPLFITKSTWSYPQDTSDINTTKVFEEGKAEEGEVGEGVYSLVRILLGILLRILLRNLLCILLLKFLVKQKGWETHFFFQCVQTWRQFLLLKVKWRNYHKKDKRRFLVRV